MKQIFWTIPANTPIHTQGTKIIIEKSNDIKHAFGSYSLFVMYFENENERYWVSDPISYVMANKLATIYKEVIESSISIMEMNKQ